MEDQGAANLKQLMQGAANDKRLAQQNKGTIRKSIGNSVKPPTIKEREVPLRDRSPRSGTKTWRG